MGMALKEELDRFMTRCIEHQQNVAQVNEEVYINQLYHSADPKSPIGLALMARVTDETMRDETPLEHFIQKAKAYRAEWQARRPKNQDPFFRYIQGRIDQLDIQFQGDALTADAILYWQDVVDTKEVNRTPWSDVEFALGMLNGLKAEVDKQRNDFYTSPTVEQLEVLEDMPQYAKKAAQIVRSAKRIVENTKSKDSFDTNKVPQYEDFQFKQISDLRALTELKNYLLKTMGAITESHAAVWRRRRVCKGETPAEAFAKVRDEAACLASSGLVNFQADRELYELVTKRDIVNGPFFGVTLYDHVRPLMKAQIARMSHLQTDPDRFNQIADMYAQIAQREFQDSSHEDPDFNRCVVADWARHGLPPKWATIDRDLLPYMKSQPKSEEERARRDGGKTKADAPASGSRADAGRERQVCSYCKFPGHVVKDCKKKKAALGALANDAVQQQAMALVAAMEALKSGTAAHKPGSRLHDKTQQSGHPEFQGSIPICRTCTRINNNSPVYHRVKLSCALDNHDVVPNSQSKHPLVQKEIDRRRAVAGYPPMPPYTANAPQSQQQRSNPRVGAAAEARMGVDTSNYDSYDGPGSQYPFAGMMSVVPSQSSGNTRAAVVRKARQGCISVDPADALHLNVDTGVFSCTACDLPCDVTYDPRGYPEEVLCTECEEVYFKSDRLPMAWMHHTIWNAHSARIAAASEAGDDSAAFGTVIPVASTVAPSTVERPLTLEQRQEQRMVVARLWPAAVRSPTAATLLNFAQELARLPTAEQLMFAPRLLADGVQLPQVPNLDKSLCQADESAVGVEPAVDTTLVQRGVQALTIAPQPRFVKPTPEQRAKADEGGAPSGCSSLAGSPRVHNPQPSAQVHVRLPSTPPAQPDPVEELQAATDGGDGSDIEDQPRTHMSIPISLLTLCGLWSDEVDLDDPAAYVARLVSICTASADDDTVATQDARLEAMRDDLQSKDVTIALLDDKLEKRAALIQQEADKRVALIQAEADKRVALVQQQLEQHRALINEQADLRIIAANRQADERIASEKATTEVRIAECLAREAASTSAAHTAIQQWQQDASRQLADLQKANQEHATKFAVVDSAVIAARTDINELQRWSAVALEDFRGLHSNLGVWRTALAELQHNAGAATFQTVQDMLQRISELQAELMTAFTKERQAQLNDAVVNLQRLDLMTQKHAHLLLEIRTHAPAITALRAHVQNLVGDIVTLWANLVQLRGRTNPEWREELGIPFPPNLAKLVKLVPAVPYHVPCSVDVHIPLKGQAITASNMFETTLPLLTDTSDVNFYDAPNVDAPTSAGGGEIGISTYSLGHQSPVSVTNLFATRSPDSVSLAPPPTFSNAGNPPPADGSEPAHVLQFIAESSWPTFPELPSVASFLQDFTPLPSLPALRVGPVQTPRPPTTTDEPMELTAAPMDWDPRSAEKSPRPLTAESVPAGQETTAADTRPDRAAPGDAGTTTSHPRKALGHRKSSSKADAMPTETATGVAKRTARMARQMTPPPSPLAEATLDIPEHLSAPTSTTTTPTHQSGTPVSDQGSAADSEAATASTAAVAVVRRQSTRQAIKLHASLNENKLAGTSIDQKPGGGCFQTSPADQAPPSPASSDGVQPLYDDHILYQLEALDAREQLDSQRAAAVAASIQAVKDHVFAAGPKKLESWEGKSYAAVPSDDEDIGNTTPVHANQAAAAPAAAATTTETDTPGPDSDAPLRPRRQRGGKKNRSRRNAAAGRPSGLSPEAALWPDINPKLKPSVIGDTLSRLGADGTYQMSDYEKQQHSRFNSSKATVYSHDQSDPATSVRMFDLAQENGITPRSVMWDTGADLGVCIAPDVAKHLGLTWTPGFQLVGVSGLGGSEGEADQQIIIRIGGDGREGDVETTELGGALIIRVRPIIMTHQMARNVKHAVLIGSHVIWRSVATFDPLTETVTMSPAFLRYGALGLRTTVPCKMSKQLPTALCAWTECSQKQPDNASFIPDNVPAYVPPQATRAEPTAPAAPRPAPAQTRQPVVAAVHRQPADLVSNRGGARTSQLKEQKGTVYSTSPRAEPGAANSATPPPRLSAAAANKVAPAQKRVEWGSAVSPTRAQTPASKTAPAAAEARMLIDSWKPKEPLTDNRGSSPSPKSSVPSASPVSLKEFPPLAAPLHPGHPQKAPIATDEEYRAKRAEEAKRNLANRATAQKLRDEIAARQNGTYRKAVQQPAWHRMSAQERMASDLTTVISREQALGKRVQALEVAVTTLKSMFTPSRSAPVETIQGPVREITPPLDQPAPAVARQTPAQPAAAPPNVPAPSAPATTGAPAPQTSQPEAPAPSPVPAAGLARTPYYGPSQQPRPSRRQRKKVNAAQRSKHAMRTRSNAQQQGGPPVVATTLPEWRLHNVGVPFQEAREAAAAKRRPKTGLAAQATAAIVGALVAASVPTASASPAQTRANSFSPSEDSGVFWTQVALASAIWALFVVARHAARRSRALARAVNVATLIAVITCAAQTIGAVTPLAQLWQSAGAIGAAAPIFWVVALSCVIAAICWRHAEQRLFRKAHKL